MKEAELKKNTNRSWFSNNFFSTIWYILVFIYLLIPHSVINIVFFVLAGLICLNLTFLYYKFTNRKDKVLLQRGFIKTNLFFIFSIGAAFLLIKGFAYISTNLAFLLPESTGYVFIAILTLGGLFYLIGLTLNFVERLCEE